MKITDRLKVEHGVFLQQLEVLERLALGRAPLPVLRAVVETIAAAEERHAEIEERVLWPAVRKAVGADFRPIAESAEAHQRIGRMVEEVRRESFDVGLVVRLVIELRQHLEDEIHGAFRLVEELLTEGQLEALCDWDAEHVYATAGKWEAWQQKWDAAATS
jgi:hypothetical protein